MGRDSGEFSDRSNPGDRGDDDLKLFRERFLDQPAEPEAVSGNTNDNRSEASTGPVRVIVKQDGIGRTGGIVLGIVAGLALGVAIMTLVIYLKDSREQREQTDRTFSQMREATARDYRELERETRLNAQATDDMRASLIARGINPNNHDITDPGGNKP